MCFTWVGSGHTCKHLAKLETLAMNIHTSLLQTLVNYKSKKLYNIGPRSGSFINSPNVIKNFHRLKFTSGKARDDSAPSSIFHAASSPKICTRSEIIFHSSGAVPLKVAIKVSAR
jgi:hypothetical protein